MGLRDRAGCGAVGFLSRVDDAPDDRWAAVDGRVGASMPTLATD